MYEFLLKTAVAVVTRWHARRARRPTGEVGMTSLEWVIYAVLAIVITGIVVTAITAAVNARVPTIK